MPRTLAGDAQNNMGPCDPRCTLVIHKDQQVSNRVRRRCTQRIDDMERGQADTRAEEYFGFSTTEPGPSKLPVPGFDFSGYIMKTLASAPQPLLEHNNDLQDMDTTMPTWGLSDTETGNPSVNSEGDHTMRPEGIDEDEALDNDTDGASDADSESSDAEHQVYLSSPAAYNYASSSGGDFDTEIDAGPSVLDELYTISPSSSQEFSPESEPPVSPRDDQNSRPLTPTGLQENPSNQGAEFESTAPSQPQPHPADAAPDLPPAQSPTPEPLKALPDALRTWREIDKHKKHLKREGKAPGTLEDIQDGTIWIKLTKDGQPFFGDDENNIGFILMCDWFQPNSRQGAPSYSTGVISLCIANLPPHLRARPENKIIVGVIPGPHEPNVNTMNNFLEPMVLELMSLWNEGISIKNPDDGVDRHVYAALVACACDSPAARKVGGFPGTGGTYPCLVDWQFHTVWVDMKHLRPGKELDELQAMVQSTLRPRHCGRPPSGLGTSSAGSLTADPLRSLVTIDLPLAIPVLWDKVDIHSVEQRAHEEWARRKQIQEKKQAEAQQGDKVTRAATKARHMKEANAVPALQVPRKRRRKSKAGPVAPTSDTDEFSDTEALANARRVHEDDASERGLLSWRLEDDEGILLLASAIKLLGSRTVTEDGIKAGERLNFTLKNTNDNRHGGGEREMTFAIAFHRRRASITRLTNIASDLNDPLSEWADYMLTLGRSDLRGTVALEAFEGMNIGENTHLRKQRKGKEVRLKLHHFEAIAAVLERTHPELSFRRSIREHGNTPVLNLEARPLREILLNGRIFSMASLCDSIVKARTFESGVAVERVGEIVDFWEHTSLFHSDETGEELTRSHTFALVRWYKASPIFLPRPVHLWSEKFSHLDIEIHVPDEYLEAEAIIPTHDIICHCARMNATIGKDPVWLTIGLERE
ncbi:unnamed protein product [Rhizoctonia solani]|uniref:Uncharacterized protein n=1 Tax=Rhizoctonia solani TaxID=456999 RepID=A0A8H3DID7_9AGAM|nr:unnamed protein product [Rhizoctonia solani]